MRDYFYVFMWVGDVVATGASDHVIESRSSLKSRGGGEGYVGHFYSLMNCFKNDLISAVHQKNYNG